MCESSFVLDVQRDSPMMPRVHGSRLGTERYRLYVGGTPRGSHRNGCYCFRDKNAISDGVQLP
jgi:hypothetical protein